MTIDDLSIGLGLVFVLGGIVAAFVVGHAYGVSDTRDEAVANRAAEYYLDTADCSICFRWKGGKK